ncbi:MAG: histidine kinase [Desulfobulbaceae bacterium]|nr:histidine kinase [Desulfobulbaceae bacterium]
MQKEMLPSTWVRGRVLISLFLLVLFYTTLNYLIIKVVFKPGYQEMERELAVGQLGRLEEIIDDELRGLVTVVGNYPIAEVLRELSAVDVGANAIFHSVMKDGKVSSPQLLQSGQSESLDQSAIFLAEISQEKVESLKCLGDDSERRAGLVMSGSGLSAFTMRCVSLGSSGEVVGFVITKGLNEQIDTFSRQFDLKSRVVVGSYDQGLSQERGLPKERYHIEETESHLKMRMPIFGSISKPHPFLEVSLEKRFSHKGGVILDYIMVSSVSGGTLLMVLFLVLYRHEITIAKTQLQRTMNRQIDNFSRQIRTESDPIDNSHIVLEEEQRRLVLQAKTIREYQEKIIRERTTVLKETNAKLVAEIKERLRIEKDLQEVQNKLEETVDKRTLELVRANTFLREEIEERKTRERELKTYQEQLRYLSSSLLNIEERERRQIATDLHDRIGQSLSVAKMYVDGLLELSLDLKDDNGKKMLKVQGLLQQTIRDTRTLTFELSPPVLYELGLEAALEWLAERMQLQHDLEVEVCCDISSPSMSASFLALIFRSIRELLMNVVRHGKASSAVITVFMRERMLHVEVSDNGVGIDLTVMNDDKRTGGGFGLFSIRERLINVGGKVDITSPSGSGAKVVLMVPVESFCSE